MRLSSTLPLRIKLAGPAATGEFAGIAATWVADRHGERFQRGAFADSLRDWKARGSLPPLLWGHDPSEPLGALIAAEETDVGLEIVGRIALGTGTGRRAHELLKTAPGALALSVGFDSDHPDMQDGIPTFTRVDWAELSLVPIPAQHGAIVTQVKAAERFQSRKDFEHAARHALNLSANEAKRLAAGGWSALTRHEPESEPDNNAAAIVAALSRIATAR